MKKKLLILFFVLSNLMLSKDDDNIPFHKELTEIGKSIFGNVMGGTNVILNSKSYSREEFELYFKLHPHQIQSLDNIDKTRKEFEKMFNRDYLNKYYTNYVLELYFVDKNNELKIKIYYRESKDDKGYDYLKTINDSTGEAYFYVPFIWEEITVITENKKIQSRKDYFGTEGKLYEYLLELFKEEIPKEFFEQRNVKRYKEVYEPDYIEPNKKYN